MIRKDLYYFKEGKLELSMLDEGINEEAEISSEVVEQLADLDTLEFKGDSVYIELGRLAANPQNAEDAPSEETSLKVSDEIYNTLKTMSEFLTKPEKEKIESVPDEIIGTLLDEPDKQKGQIHDTIKKNKVIGIEELIYHDASMQQNSIDALLLSHFGETTPKFKYANELKEQIEKQMKKIKFYK